MSAKLSIKPKPNIDELIMTYTLMRVNQVWGGHDCITSIAGRLFKSFEFENESRMSDKKLVIL